jgi:hypothetical protein
VAVWALSGCVQDGCDQKLDVALVDAGERVAKADR